jgi:hypothetical protein
MTDYRTREGKEEGREEQEGRDLTLLMEDGAGGDISIIGSSKMTTSYVQWRSRGGRRGEEPELSILEEDML